MRLPAFQFLQLEKVAEIEEPSWGRIASRIGKTSDAPRCLAHDMTKELGR
ncbi:hypothetical protein [uncultured Bartonella sp.]|nr:hypothetical protein [uncultured Bartonella sp.]